MGEGLSTTQELFHWKFREGDSTIDMHLFLPDSVFPMHKLIGSYYRLLYNLDTHYFVEVRLRSWVNWALVMLAVLTLLGIFPGSYYLAIFFVLLIILLSLSSRYARRRYYIHFVPEKPAGSPETSPAPLWPEDKLLLHASGHFHVEDAEGDWTGLIAYYRTFETREHAIMARLTPTTFLKLGQVNPETLGMWYIFISPENLLDVTPGTSYFGGGGEPALRLRWRRFDEKGKPIGDEAFLHFGSIADRARAQADLLLDMGGPPRRPWRRPRGEAEN